MKKSVHILPAPYGTNLSHLGLQPDQVTEHSFHHGANVGVANTFPSRRALIDHFAHGENPDSLQTVIETFNAGIDGEVARVRSITQRMATGSEDLSIAAFFGPATDRCYWDDFNPQTTEIHRIQVAKLCGLIERREISYGLFETIPTKTESDTLAEVIAASGENARCVISFTLAPDGKLRDGCTLAEAIRSADEKLGDIDNPIIGYAFNCCTTDGIELAAQEVQRKGLAHRLVGGYINASTTDASDLQGAGVNHGVEQLQNGQLDRFSRVLSQIEHPELELRGGCCGFRPQDIPLVANLSH